MSQSREHCYKESKEFTDDDDDDDDGRSLFLWRWRVLVLRTGPKSIDPFGYHFVGCKTAANAIQGGRSRRVVI